MPDDRNATSRSAVAEYLGQVADRGDLQEMRAAAEAARRALYPLNWTHDMIADPEDFRAALKELDSAIAHGGRGTVAASEGGGGGPRAPYGNAIRDAIARGDLVHMRAVGAAARAALFTDSPSIAGAMRSELESALEELEKSIQSLRNRRPRT